MDTLKGIVSVLSFILTQMAERNDKVPLQPSQLTLFHANKTPSVSIQSYLQRITSFHPCSHDCYIVALIYIDRIIQNNQNFVLTSRNVHRLLITSVMLASKFFDDSFYNNMYYAKLGGLPVSEVNLLEIHFLFLMDFSLNVTPEVFGRYRSELLKHSTHNAIPASPALEVDAQPVSHSYKQYVDDGRYSQPQPQPQPQQPQYNNYNPQPYHYYYYYCYNTNQHPPRSDHNAATTIGIAPSLVRRTCETLIGEEIRNKRLPPAVAKRASELLLMEERKHKALTTSSVKSVCERLVEENTILSPSLVQRACLRVESLRYTNPVTYGFDRACVQ